MISEINELQRCKAIIERQLDWGPAETWQTADFENLSELILTRTGVSLSISTLRRMWGRVEYNHLPSTTTLNTLARFAGAEDWRAFVKDGRRTAEPMLESSVQITERQTRYKWKTLAGVATLILALILVGILAFDKGEPQLEKEAYVFGSRPVTRGIPNSVVFTYDATASPTDSVFIQQSWDESRRVLVDKNLHKHTSVYYEPGVYQAKLTIGKQVVQQHKLVIATQGWSGLIERPSVPVYLRQSEFLHQDQIYTSIETIKSKNIEMQPEPPVVKYFNVGNFEPVPIDDFGFSCEVKSLYSEGAAACQFTYISLLTDDMPIGIPLSSKGCVSELSMVSVDNYTSGKKADLSALGVDFSDWVSVSCNASQGRIRYFINQKMAFEFPVPKRKVKIVGIAFGFRGTGAIHKVSLKAKGKEVLNAF
jgi:hypothetical protein